MCYDNKAQPPDLPEGIGGGGAGQELTLKAADGNEFMAFAAQAAQSQGAQILIYPDVRGLHQFYKDLAMRFADAGYTALAMDYFGRTAPSNDRSDSFDYMPQVNQMKPAGLFADASAAVAHLHTLAGAPQPIFSIGFCMGGTISLYSGMEDLGLAGVIGFYTGMRRVLDEQKGPLPEAGKYMKVPVLGLYGGADQSIPPEQIQSLDAALNEAGVSHSLHTYEGLPHSFFDRTYAQWKNECDDAWKRIFAFVSEHK